VEEMQSAKPSKYDESKEKEKAAEMQPFL